MNKKLIFAGAAAGLVLFGVAAFFLFRDQTLNLVRPTRGPAVEAVYATGTVEPVRFARVGSKVAGRVAEVYVQEGDAVAAGGVLAVIDSTAEAARVRELEAKLELARTDAERTRRLYRDGHVSQAALDKAVSAFDSAGAALDAARAQLEDYTIRAPLKGRVLRSEQQLELGDQVQPNQILFVIGDATDLWIEAEVDEEDIPQVAIGQRALIRADAFPGQALEGSIAQITPFGDPIARSYRVHIGLPADTPVLAGMTTEVNIVVREEENALLVPVTALAGTDVWVVEGGRAVKQPVVVGALGGDLVEIKSGLNEDALVIASPPTGLQVGDKIDASSGLVGS